MCQDIKDCILRGDIGRWASHLHLASAYANTMLLEWFQHNFCRREICSVEVEMERLSQGTYCMITCVIQIFYQTGYRFHETVDRKSTRLNSSHRLESRMPSSA